MSSNCKCTKNSYVPICNQVDIQYLNEISAKSLVLDNDAI